MNVGGGIGLLVRDIVKKYFYVYGIVFYFFYFIVDVFGMEGFVLFYWFVKKYVYYFYFEIFLGV